MPKYSKSDINHIVTDEEFKRIVQRTIHFRDRFFLALLYVTGRRPSEITGDHDPKTGRTVEGMKRKDIIIDEENHEIIFTIPISKTRRGSFHVSHTKLIVEYDEDDLPIRIIRKNIARFRDKENNIKHPELPLFNFTRRTGYNIVSRASRVIGISLCPYNFRHSRLTHLAEEGASINEMLRFKGSKSLKGLEPYLHAQEVKVSRKKNNI